MEITTNSQGAEVVRCIRPVVEPSFEHPGRVTNSLKIFQAFVNSLRRWRNASDFHSPVDAIELGVPDYYQVITKPMDLSTIQQRLANNYYYSVEEAIGDFRQMLENCFLYNKETHHVHMAGLELQQVFEREVKKLPAVEEEINLQTTTVRRRQVSVTTTLTRIVPAYILRCRDVFRAVIEDCRDFVQHFFYPRDLEKLCVGEEHMDIVKHSTDLSTIRMKLDQCLYSNTDEFLCDMRLIYMNALQLSMPHNEIYKQACRLRDSFELHIAREESSYERPLETSTPNTWLPVEPSKQSSAIHSVSVDGNVVRILSHTTNPVDEEWKAVKRLLTVFIEKAERMTDRVSSLREEYLRHGEESIDSTQKLVNKSIHLVKESVQFSKNNRDRGKLLSSKAPVVVKTNFPIMPESKIPSLPKSVVPFVWESKVSTVPELKFQLTEPESKIRIEPMSKFSISSESNYPNLSESKESFVPALKFPIVSESKAPFVHQVKVPIFPENSHDTLLMDLDVSSSSSCVSDSDENHLVEESMMPPLSEKQFYDASKIISEADYPKGAASNAALPPTNPSKVIKSEVQMKIAQFDIQKKLLDKELQPMNNGNEKHLSGAKLTTELAIKSMDLKAMPVMRDKNFKDLAKATNPANNLEHRMCSAKRLQLDDDMLEPKFEPWQAVKAAPWQLFENDLISLKETKPKFVIVRIPLPKNGTKNGLPKKLKKSRAKMEKRDKHFNQEDVDGVQIALTNLTGYNDGSQSSSSSSMLDSELSTDSSSDYLLQ